MHSYCLIEVTPMLQTVVQPSLDQGSFCVCTKPLIGWTHTQNYPCGQSKICNLLSAAVWWTCMTHVWLLSRCTVYPKKYAHGIVVLCFVVIMQSFIMNSHEVFIHIHQDCFAGTGAIVRLPQCQWSKPDGYGKISQCITTTKHSKAKTVCIFLGIYWSDI